ncbi:hypothetical protein F4779DRAFT_393261 [Xylariaceae sp. FL0662B]|nr:hypothetical protein F4779DRAFT_393261 [Xylariaceae sp. FL0662B]
MCLLHNTQFSYRGYFFPSFLLGKRGEYKNISGEAHKRRCWFLFPLSSGLCSWKNIYLCISKMSWFKARWLSLPGGIFGLSGLLIQFLFLPAIYLSFLNLLTCPTPTSVVILLTCTRVSVCIYRELLKRLVRHVYTVWLAYYSSYRRIRVVTN